MAPYKRADLLFQDPERLYNLIRRSPVPILFIYAGKAHPSDGLGQDVLQRLKQWSLDPRFVGSVLVLENYDLSYSRKLLAGSDIWLNTPLRPLEASGTSGMKGSINGTLHFSVADGWWPEVYNGRNGWMVGTGSETWSNELQDSYDRNRILHILENEVLKDFCKGKQEAFSEKWVQRVRESIMSSIPFVCSERMMTDYENRLYRPALNAERDLAQDKFRQLKNLEQYRTDLNAAWSKVTFEEVDVKGLHAEVVARGQSSDFTVEILHPGLDTNQLNIEAILTQRRAALGGSENIVIPLCPDPKNVKGSGRSKWILQLKHQSAGEFSLAFRAVAQCYPGFEDPGYELRLVKWL